MEREGELPAGRGAVTETLASVEGGHERVRIYYNVRRRDGNEISTHREGEAKELTTTNQLVEGDVDKAVRRSKERDQGEACTDTSVQSQRIRNDVAPAYWIALRTWSIGLRTRWSEHSHEPLLV